MAIQRTCLLVMGIQLRMISSDDNAAITPTVGVGYTLLPGRGRQRGLVGVRGVEPFEQMAKHNLKLAIILNCGSMKPFWYKYKKNSK